MKVGEERRNTSKAVINCLGVAGGGSGIGRATCIQLARNGTRVIVTDINLEAARQTATLLPGESPPSVCCLVSHYT